MGLQELQALVELQSASPEGYQVIDLLDGAEMLTQVCKNSAMPSDWQQGIDASIGDAIIHLFKMKQAVNGPGSTADAVTQHIAVINMDFRLPLMPSGLFKAGASYTFC